MKNIIGKMKGSFKSGKRKVVEFFLRNRYLSGITVIELVLILVIICTCI